MLPLIDRVKIGNTLPAECDSNHSADYGNVIERGPPIELFPIRK